MALKLTNNASSTLAATITDVATTLSVATGHGTRFPAIATVDGDWFPLTLEDASGNLEVCRATDVTGDVITVTRAQEGTTGFAFTAGAMVQLRITAKSRADQTIMDLPEFVADQFWQVNAGATAVESKSATQVLATLGLPAYSGNGDKFIRINTAGTAAEVRTATQVLADIGLPAYSGNGDKFIRINTAGTAAEVRTAAQVLVDIAALPLAGGTVTGPVVFSDQLVSKQILKDFSIEVFDHGNTGATETIDIDD